jgi:hypothetical protein
VDGPGIASGSDCQCSETTVFSERSCLAKASLESDLVSTVVVLFSSELSRSTVKTDFEVKLNDKALKESDWEFQGNSTSAVLTLGRQRSDKRVTVVLASDLQDTRGWHFYPPQLEGSLKGNSTSTSEEEANERMVGTVATLGNFVGLAGSLMLGDSQLFVSMFLSIQLITYLPLADFNISSAVRGLFKASNSINSLEKLPWSLQCTKPYALASQYGFKCSEFLINADKELLMLTTLGLLLLTFSLVLTRVRLDSFLKLISKQVVALLTCSAIEFSVKAGIQLVSLSSAAGITIVGAVLFVYTLLGVAVAYFTQHKQDVLQEYLHFLTPSKTAQGYYCVFVVHSMSYGLILTMLDSPVLQMSILLAGIASVKSY